MKVKIKKLHPDAIVPTYGTDGAAAFDIYAISDDEYNLIDSFFGAVTFRTGLAFEIPQGHVMRVYSRSGHGFKNDTSLSNSVGVIDSDYRGELFVRLYNHGTEPFTVRKGDRIAQAIVEPIERVTFEVVDELSETSRGSGGLGSTGA